MKMRYLSLLVTSLGTIWAGPIQAQAADSERLAKDVTRCGVNKVWNARKKACEAADVEQLAEVVVVANRSPFDSNRYAGQVAKIESNALSSESRIMDSLSSIPGIEQGRDVGRQIGQDFTIRGFGYQSSERVIIEQDGVSRDPTLFSNQISSFRTDTDILKKVEVVKGASSVLHGSGAIGGVVGMSTKDASDYLRPGQEFGVGAGARYESNRMSSGMLQFYGRPNKLPVDFLLHSKYARHGNIDLAQGGYNDPVLGKANPKTRNNEQVKTQLAKLGWSISPYSRLSFSVFNLNEELDTTWQTLFFTGPSDLEEPLPVRGWLKQRDYVLDYRYFPDNPLIDLNFKAYHTKSSYHRITEGVNRFGPYRSDYENSDRRYGFSLKNVSTFSTGLLEHELIAGLDYKNVRLGNQFYTLKGMLDNGAFPNTSRDVGVYIQDSISYGPALLTLAGRYDHFNRKVNRVGQQVYRKQHFSPRLAFAFEAADGFNLLAGYAETFRAPTPTETALTGPINPHFHMVPNYNLKPEIAKEYEAGFSLVKDNLFDKGHRMNLKATYFNGRVEDMIDQEYRDDLGKPPATVPSSARRRYAQYQNIGKVKRSGYEIDFKYALNSWRFGAAYGHLKLFNPQTGRLVKAYADGLTANASYTYRPWDLTMGLELKHWRRPKNIMPYYDNDPKEPYVDRPFTLLDFKGVWKPTRTGSPFFDQNVAVAFGVNNLFDRQYKRAGSLDSTTRVGTGRNIYVQVEKRF